MVRRSHRHACALFYTGAMKNTKTYLLAWFKFSASLMLLIGFLFISKLTTTYFQIAFPSALLAMLIVFVLLVTNIVKESWIAPACQPILKYMALFFIPAGVGLVEHISVFAAHWSLLLLVLLLVPLIGLVLVSFIASLRGKHA